MNKVPRWVFRYVGNKTFDFSSKKRIFCPKTTKLGPKLAFLVNLGQAMQAYSVVGRLVVVARGLYLARHRFTLLSRLKSSVHFERLLRKSSMQPFLYCIYCAYGVVY